MNIVYVGNACIPDDLLPWPGRKYLLIFKSLVYFKDWEHEDYGNICPD